MSFSEFWITNHTWISIVIGFIITFAISKIPKLHIIIKVIIIFILVLFLTGFSGLLQFVLAFVALIAILYGALVSIFSIGLIIFIYIAHINSWNLIWWHWILIVGIWSIISPLVNFLFIILFSSIFQLIGVTYSKLPRKIRDRMGIE